MFSINEFTDIIDYIDDYDIINGYEINVSCPNVKKGGIAFSSDLKLFSKLLKKIRYKTDKLIIIKLSPSSGSIIKFAKMSKKLNADAITIANTYKGTLIDTENKKIKIQGGLSGPAIFPITLTHVLEISKAVNIPIIASGGIYDADTAIQYLLAGAKAVQIGTQNFINPKSSLDVINGINKYLIKNSIEDINEIIGTVKL